MKNCKTIGISLLLSGLSCTLTGQVFHKVVAKDGTGNYTTIQSALNSVASDNPARTLIFIKKGIYTEKVNLSSTKTNVSLIGENEDSVIISWGDYNPNTSTAESYTFLTEGNDFYAENITVENTAGSVGQAVAIRTTGDRQVFKNCRFTGFQDTYYAHKKRQYNLNCYINGATDFIFGDATAVFENCTIDCKTGGQYITAPADTKLTSVVNSATFYHGLLFIDCYVTAFSGVSDNSYYLGRPWQAGASSVYINCKLGSHIKPEGWSTWEGNNHLTGCFAEYKSRNFDMSLVDVSSRVTWSKQLTENEVDNYYNLDYFLMKDDVVWDPLPITEALDAPTSLTVEQFNLSWSAIDSAIGYVIYRNDSAIGFSTSNSYEDLTASSNNTNTYYVKSVSKNGNLSESSNMVTGISNQIAPCQDIKIYVANKQLIFSEQVDVEIFSLDGYLLKKKKIVNHLSVPELKCGLYIVKTYDHNNYIHINKIIIK